MARRDKALLVIVAFWSVTASDVHKRKTRWVLTNIYELGREKFVRRARLANGKKQSGQLPSYGCDCQEKGDRLMGTRSRQQLILILLRLGDPLQ